MATGRVPTTANSPLTTKGDLFGYSTTQARVAVGSDGDTLVADSAASTGLRWQGDYAAGKNKIINGAFDIWQRGTSFTPSSGATTYTADRFYIFMSGTYSATVSQQAFTAGSAPAAPYEAQYFWRNTISSITGSLSFNRFGQKIEDVRTLANQSITISFWAKAGSNASWTPQIVQDFGSGGSSAVFTSGTAVSVTTSWQRFTQTITVPSVSGKTIGTGNSLTFIIDMPVSGAQTNDVWGVQVEAGSVATAFQTATGTLQGEIDLCQRYFAKSYNLATAPGTNTNDGLNYGALSSGGATTAYLNYEIIFPIRMRTAPTVTTYDIADTSGKVSRTTPGVGDENNITPSTAFNSEARILIQSSTGASHTGLALHYTASAEL